MTPRIPLQRIFTKLLHLTIAGGLCALLAGCETFTESAPSAGWQRTSNGATVWHKPRFHASQRYTWDGGTNAQGYAHGRGVFTSYNPEIPAWDMFSSGYYEQKLTMTGNMVNGRFEGDVYVDNHMPAKGRWYSVDNYSGGFQVNTRQLSHQAYQSGSDSLTDAQLVGGILAVGGASAGDANVSGAGVKMIQGDTHGGIRQLGHSAGAPGHNPTTGASEPNLIDEWGLGKHRNGNSHIVNYIRAADSAYDAYKRSGDSRHYAQHKEYAGLARDFDRRTRN